MQVPLQEEFKCTIRNAPELMKLVEEFYRAYRALAERYDFATNELCHAQETLQAAFPDQEVFEDFESSNQALYFWILRCDNSYFRTYFCALM
ncbi:putative protein Networked (NET), actin-binding (NAB) [Helianthus anomalus]